MKRRLIWISILLLALPLIGYSIYLRVVRARALEETGEEVPVLAVHPSRGEIERTLSYAGTLEPQALVTVTSKIEGRIQEILATEGEAVTEGRVLVVMESDAARLELEQAESARRAAQAQYEKACRGVREEELANAKALLEQAEKDFVTAEEGFRRSENLYREGALAKARFEEAERQLRAAQTQLENARRSVRMMEQGAGSEEQNMAEANLRGAEARAGLAKLQLDYTRIRSPITGRVAKVLSDEGNMASRTTPLLALVRDDIMLLRIPVPERHYEEFAGRKDIIQSRVRFSALPAQGPFSGRISALSPTVDPSSRTFSVEVEIFNPSGVLKAGMYGNVEFVLERRSGALLVRSPALVVRNGRTGVFLVGSGSPPVAVFREVRTGLSDAERTEILEGLSERDSVIEEGNSFLENGQRISVRER